MIERRCAARPDLDVRDGSPWVVLNASSWEDAPDADLRDVLRYLWTGDAGGPLSEEIDALVDAFNKDREWVDRVLTYEQETEMRCRRAREEGREEGAIALGALMAALLDAGRIDDARRAAEDAATRDELARELGLVGGDGR